MPVWRPTAVTTCPVSDMSSKCLFAVQQATAHGELLYQQVPHWCLNWNYRWPGLLAEIVHYKPDVMSLQEVDHFDELASRLGPLG